MSQVNGEHILHFGSSSPLLPILGGCPFGFPKPQNKKLAPTPKMTVADLRQLGRKESADQAGRGLAWSDVFFGNCQLTNVDPTSINLSLSGGP